MLEKILLALLLLLLPVSALLTRYYFTKSAHPTVSVENLEKVDLMLSQLQKSIAEEKAPAEIPEIKIISVFYATQSGTLTVSGIAPKSQASVRVSVLENEKKTQTKKTASASAVLAQASPSAVLGESVEERALPAKGDGVFALEYPVENENLDSLELRFVQGPASKTVIYHFEKASYEQL